MAHTGGGRVTGSEISDEESYYEVEVTLADGRQVDVQLDEAFNVVGTTMDDESGDGDNGSFDDDDGTNQLAASTEGDDDQSGGDDDADDLDDESDDDDLNELDD